MCSSLQSSASDGRFSLREPVEWNNAVRVVPARGPLLDDGDHLVMREPVDVVAGERRPSITSTIRNEKSYVYEPMM
jgi:hypothetical protein